MMIYLSKLKGEGVDSYEIDYYMPINLTQEVL